MKLFLGNPIATTDVTASSMPQPRGSCWFWLPRGLTWWLLGCPHHLLLQRKLCLYLSKSHLVFSSPIDAEELQSQPRMYSYVNGKMYKLGCSCAHVFVQKFFTAFVIMTLVFLFVVLSCACDYLYYKCNLHCYERDRPCYERDKLCYERDCK